MFLRVCFCVPGRRSASGNSIQYNNIEFLNSILTAQKKVHDRGINSRSGLEIYIRRMISTGQRGMTKLAQGLWNIVFEWNVSSKVVKHWHLQDEAHFYPSDNSRMCLSALCDDIKLFSIFHFAVLSHEKKKKKPCFTDGRTDLPSRVSRSVGTFFFFLVAKMTLLKAQKFPKISDFFWEKKIGKVFSDVFESFQPNILWLHFV